MLEFSKDFFKDEIRCDFEVPVMMKRAWAAAMEVLAVVDDICRRNNIKYFADGGTLLGAVRHKGFIPWDDDIDLCLRREEYNKLIKILPAELPKGFVVAGMYADCTRLQEAAEVAHLRVIADETQWDYNDYIMRFHGFPYLRIGVDIFPWDYVARDECMADLQKKIIQYIIITLQNWDSFNADSTLENRLSEIERVCNVSIPRNNSIKNYLWRLVDNVTSLCTADEADDVGNYVYLIEEDNYRVRKECFEEVVYMPFENMMIPVPADYDTLLTAKYGDYMQHVKAYVDHSYPFYGHMEEDLKKEIRNVGFEGSVEDFCREVEAGRYRVNAR